MDVKRSKSEGFMLRFPDGMREQIKDAASASERSMNAEIVDRLGWSFEAWPRVTLGPAMKEKAKQLGQAQRENLEREISAYANEKLSSLLPQANLELRIIEAALDRAIAKDTNRDAELLIRNFTSFFEVYRDIVPDDLVHDVEEIFRKKIDLLKSKGV